MVGVIQVNNKIINEAALLPPKPNIRSAWLGPTSSYLIWSSTIFISTFHSSNGDTPSTPGQASFLLALTQLPCFDHTINCDCIEMKPQTGIGLWVWEVSDRSSDNSFVSFGLDCYQHLSTPFDHQYVCTTSNSTLCLSLLTCYLFIWVPFFFFLNVSKHHKEVTSHLSLPFLLQNDLLSLLILGLFVDLFYFIFMNIYWLKITLMFD